jgi:hypothetical protein
VPKRQGGLSSAVLRLRTSLALTLTLTLTLGCRDRQPAPDIAQTEPTHERPGLRSAAPLPGVRPLEFTDPIGSSPGVAVDDEGIVLAWMSDVGQPTLKLSRLAAGHHEWSEAQIVATNPRLLINWADVPAVGHTLAGRTVVAWPEHHTDDPRGGYGLRLAAEREDGSFGPAWSPDEVGHGPESGFAGFVTSAGGLRLFWLDGRELGQPRGTMKLRSVLIDEDGQQRGPSLVHDERTCECCKLGVGLLGEQAFAAYRDRSDAEVRDIFVAGPKLAPARVAADGWTIAGCPVNGPAVATTDARAHVAWFTGADDRSTTWIARADTLTAFEAPIRFDLGLPGGRIDLLALPDGGVLISWLELDPASPGLAALLTRRLGPDGQLGPAYAVAELGAARDWGFARAAMHGDEVVWVYTDPTAADGRPRLAARVGLPPG